MLTPTVSDIREYFIEELKNENYVTDKTGVEMLEIIGASFIADQETIFGPVNADYVQRELDWYKSMSLNVADIPGKTPAIWEQVADKDGFINSNYGWCIWSEENNRQYWKVWTELLQHPNSRRAVMIYTRPTMWDDYNHNGRSDFMCTNTVQYLIRNGKLDVVVQMRSNDVVFGYRNDFAWQRHVQHLMAAALGVTPGQIHWQVGSLHVYSRHFDMVK